MDTERKLFAEQARNSAPHGIKVIHEDDRGRIPDDHIYAVIEILAEGDDGLFYGIVGTADRDGIEWAWNYAQMHHPRPASLRILDVEAARVAESMIEIH